MRGIGGPVEIEGALKANQAKILDRKQEKHRSLSSRKHMKLYFPVAGYNHDKGGKKKHLSI